jgi:hypothetical protein
MSYLFPPILRHHRRWICGSPRDLARPCSASQCDCESPRTSHPRVLPAFDLQVALNLDSFRRFQRFSDYGSPRSSISPVAPLDASRVSPVLASSGPAGDRSSSCPDSRILRRSCCVGRGLPRCFAFPVAPLDTGSEYFPVPASSGYTGNGYSSYPEPLVLRCPRCLSSRFPSRSAPPGCSSRRRFEFPRALRLPAWPWV